MKKSNFNNVIIDFQIQSKHISSHNDQAYNDTFAVDSSIGNDTVIQYSSRMLRNVALHVTDPSGKTYTEIGKNNQQGVIAVKLPGTAEVYENKFIKYVVRMLCL